MLGTGLSQSSWPLPSCCWHLAAAPQSAWSYCYRGASGLGSRDPLLLWGLTLCMWAGLASGARQAQRLDYLLPPQGRAEAKGLAAHSSRGLAVLENLLSFISYSVPF